MKYIASARDKETREIKIIKGEYDRKSDFYSDLRGNGYSVRFISTEERFDDDCEKWHSRNELRKEINREIYAGHKKLASSMGMTVKEFRALYK